VSAPADENGNAATGMPEIQPSPVDAPLPLLPLPDLIVSVSGPVNITAGEDVELTVVVENKGLVDAPGSKDVDYRESYFIDLIISEDGHFPMEPATHPTYQGYSGDDFVEDMLITGGRISNTDSIPVGEYVIYVGEYYIPKNITSGLYYIAAVVDPAGRVEENNEANNTGSYRVEIEGEEEGGDED
jgi:hypothetical protein